MKRQLVFVARMAAFAAASMLIGAFGGAVSVEACLDPQASGITAAIGFIVFIFGGYVCAYSLQQGWHCVKAMMRKRYRRLRFK